MANFFGNKKIFALLISIIVLAAVMGYTLKDRPYPTWSERFVRDSFSLVQQLLYKPAIATAGFFENLRQMYYIYEENKALKESLDQFAQVTAELNQLRYENEQLRKMLDVKSTLTDYQLRIAEVVARSPDRWNETLIIDKGSKDGIKPNMAVITPKGLIGRIQSVSNFSSQVELISDIERTNLISAVIQGKTYVYGVVEGFDPKSGYLIMRKIPLQSEIKEKELVITSGLGGVMPSGLVIGEVAKITTGDYGLTKTAYIKPSADLYQIEKVFVVERAFTAPIEIPPAQPVQPEGQPQPSANQGKVGG